MNSLNTFITLPVDALPEGIVMLTLSGSDNIPLCERLAFIQNDEGVKVKVETDKKIYNQRDSVSAKISLIVNSRIPQDAFLSLSATKNISVNSSSQFPSTISSWFLLESDVHGPVEDPSYYFDPTNPDRLKDLDLLLLTQGWRDFEWKYINMNYPPETGFAITGRLRKKFADVPLKNCKVSIGIFKSGNPIVRTVLTDSSGRFYLEELDLTGDAKLIVSATGEKERLQGWLLLDSLKYSPAKVQGNIAQSNLLLNDNQPLIDDQLLSDNYLKKENLKEFIQYAEIKNSIRKKYKLSDTINPGEVTIVAKRSDAPGSARAISRKYLRGTPDRELVITPDLQVYKNVYQLVRTKFMSPVKLPPQVSHRMQNPLFMIDGMKVSVENIVDFPVSFVERIDVLDNLASIAVFGSLGGIDPIEPIDGVISIITREGAPLKSGSQSYSTANIRFTGYNEPRIFYSPKHYTKLESDYKPDLRTTLYWEPDIKVENNKDLFLNYFNADNSSKVKVIVEGITTSGIPVTGITEYEVK
jgi:hypothetical protein